MAPHNFSLWPLGNVVTASHRPGVGRDFSYQWSYGRGTMISLEFFSFFKVVLFPFGSFAYLGTLLFYTTGRGKGGPHI